MVSASYISTNYDRVTKGYVGFIRIWEGGQLLFSESCKIVRLTIKDALKDAEIEKADILQLNSVA